MRQFATGIQATGTPHLGNIVGAVRPAVAIGMKSESPPIYIVADMHSVLSVRNPVVVKANVYRTAAAWIAFGAAGNGLLFRESKIPELSEIALLLSGTASVDVVTEGQIKPEVFSSIHTVLMSADLISLGTTHVLAGQDSRQHVSIVQDTARRFNQAYGNVLTVPGEIGNLDTPTVPGTDGYKMSKSLDNCIEVLTEPEVIKQIVAKIPEDQARTGEKPISSPDTVLRDIYSAVGTQGDKSTQYQNITNSQFSEFLIEEFRQERNEFRRLMNKPDQIVDVLEKGEAQVKEIVRETISRMHLALGLS